MDEPPFALSMRLALPASIIAKGGSFSTVSMLRLYSSTSLACGFSYEKNRHPLFSKCRFCYPIVRFDFWRKWRKFGVNPLLRAPKIKDSCGFLAVISTYRPCRPYHQQVLRVPGVPAGQRPGSQWSGPSQQRRLRSPERNE